MDAPENKAKDITDFFEHCCAQKAFLRKREEMKGQNPQPRKIPPALLKSKGFEWEKYEYEPNLQQK